MGGYLLIGLELSSGPVPSDLHLHPLAENEVVQCTTAVPALKPSQGHICLLRESRAVPVYHSSRKHYTSSSTLPVTLVRTPTKVQLEFYHSLTLGPPSLLQTYSGPSPTPHTTPSTRSSSSVPPPTPSGSCSTTTNPPTTPTSTPSKSNTSSAAAPC